MHIFYFLLFVLFIIIPIDLSFAQENDSSTVNSENEPTTLDYLLNAEQILKEVKDVYRSGDIDYALRLATIAYLENYEYVEAPLSQKDPQLMLKIELAMRDDLLRMIMEKSPSEEVDAHIDGILEDMQKAKTVVPEFGSFAIVILSVSIISLILITRGTINSKIN